jgi:hypothetical protein
MFWESSAYFALFFWAYVRRHFGRLLPTRFAGAAGHIWRATVAGGLIHSEELIGWRRNAV